MSSSNTLSQTLITQYSYYKSENKIHISIEWDDYVNHFEATCHIKDLSGVIVQTLPVGIGSSDTLETHIVLTETMNLDRPYVLEYTSENKTWLRPIFLNTVLTHKNELPYSDYVYAYYNELVSPSVELEIETKDVYNYGSLQIVQGKYGNNFTHDSRYISEKSCGFW